MVVRGVTYTVMREERDQVLLALLLDMILNLSHQSITQLYSVNARVLATELEAYSGKDMHKAKVIMSEAQSQG